MSSRQQRKANRLNAQHHHSGTADHPLSPVKSALKSGLDPESQCILVESREEFAQLQSERYLHHAPANPGASPLWGGRPEERLQVDTIIRSEWFLRRYFRIEAQLWEYHSMKAERGTGVELGEAFSQASLIFMRFQRRITLAEKSAREAKAELDRLKALPQPQQITTETQQLGSFLTTPINPDRGDQEFAQLERYMEQKLVKVGQALSPALSPAKPHHAGISDKKIS